MITSLQKQALAEAERFKRIGISMRSTNIGDRLQFSSLPENFYKKTGQKLIAVDKPWFFDHNPYLETDPTIEPKKVVELWNFPKSYDWPKPRTSVYLTNAEIHLSILGVSNPVLNRPRLYQYEEFPFEERKDILFHPFGNSHGDLPEEVISHVVNKYSDTGNLIQIGLPEHPRVCSAIIYTPNLWDLASLISRARMFIGVDSGPSWIAACYPDVQTKKVRTRFQGGYCEPMDWVPLLIDNHHSHWDDPSIFKIYNCFEEDIGFTESFRKL